MVSKSRSVQLVIVVIAVLLAAVVLVSIVGPQPKGITPSPVASGETIPPAATASP